MTADSTRYASMARARWEAHNPDVPLGDRTRHFDTVGRLIDAEVQATAKALAEATPFVGHGLGAPAHYAQFMRRAEVIVLGHQGLLVHEHVEPTEAPRSPIRVPRALYATVEGGVIEL